MNRLDNIRIVPISPYLLCQEIYINNPWRMMVCCILLNQTSGTQVHRIREELFKRWPTPQRMARADRSDLISVIRSLGLYNKRSNDLIRFSEEWLGEWDDVRELHGIGKYARDSYAIFVEDNLGVKPTDKVLQKYLRWRRLNENCNTTI